MFEIKAKESGHLQLIGRFDAAQAEKAREILCALEQSTVLDCAKLAYISSGGYSVLFEAQRRLADAGHGLKLINLSAHLREMFEIAGFDQILQIE